MDIHIIRDGRKFFAMPQELWNRIEAFRWANRNPHGESEMNEWQPIESAPKDGTRVLVFDPDSGVVYATAFQGDRWDQSSAMLVQPTHWMPLPKLPLVTRWEEKWLRG